MADETILVVDGDARSRKILEVSFKKSGYRVRMTDTIAGAVEVFEEESPDLIVSDTELPDGDGFEFCKRVKEHPEWEYTPFLFLTDESSLPRKIEGIEIGADDYLTRPIYIKEVTTRVEVLLKQRDRELLSEGAVEEFRGQLSNITLIDLLQTFDEDDRTGIVEFRRNDRTGSMTWRDGDVIDASCGKLRGAEAVYRLMLWPEGEFVVRDREEVSGSNRIEMTTEDLLLEGIRRLERWDEIVAELPRMDRVYEPDFEKLPGFLDAVPEEVGRVVRLFDGMRTVREVVADSPVGDVTAAEIIQRVFEEGILEPVEDQPDSTGEPEARKSHLADWLESGGEQASDETQRGLPASAEEDPYETQEIERDDLTTALSDQLEDEPERGGAEHSGAETSDASGPAPPSDSEVEREAAPEQGELDPDESGPRYMPGEDEDADRAYREREDESGETLDELEEAERKRRQQEAKQLASQQPSEPSTVPSEQPSGEDTRPSGAAGDGGVPRIPGATKTPAGGTEEVGDEVSAPDDEESATTQSGKWRSAVEQEVEEEPPTRNRSNTPRAHPTPSDEQPEEGDERSDAERSRKKTARGLGDTGLEQDGETGVPVSFETVDDQGGDEASDEAVKGAPEAETGQSPEPESSVTDEAAEAVRQSARKALEDAAFESDEWDSGESEGREREETSPYGTADGVDAKAPDESPADEASGMEESTSPEAPVGGETAGDEGEDVMSTAEPDDIERVSNNGEVVRTEYDLSGPGDDEERDQIAPSSDTLDGVTRKPEPADETLESDETLEGVGGESETADASGPTSDDTLEGFSGVSGEADTGSAEDPKAEREAAATDTPDEETTDQGLSWGEEPTAREPDDLAESESVGEESSTEESASEPSTGSGVRVESTAFASEESGGGDTDAPKAGTEIGHAAADAEIPDDAPPPETDARSESESEQEPEVDSSAAESPDLGHEALDAEIPETSEGTDEESEAKREPSETPGEEEEPSEESADAPAETEKPEEETSAASDEELVEAGEEATFFDEDEQEADEEFDWDYDEEVESEGGGGFWIVVAGLFVLSGLGAWAILFGPLSSSSSEDDEEKAVASSEQPTDAGTADTEGAAEDTGRLAEAADVQVPSIEDRSQATDRGRTLAGSVIDRSCQVATGLGCPELERRAVSPDVGVGADADVGTGADAGAPDDEEDEERTVAQSNQTGSSARGAGANNRGSRGGRSGVGVKLARAERLVNSGSYSQAKSLLDDVRRQAPTNSKLRSLYLQIGSAYQRSGNDAAARRAYNAYLATNPSGSRAERIRSIVENQL